VKLLTTKINEPWFSAARGIHNLQMRVVAVYLLPTDIIREAALFAV